MKKTLVLMFTALTLIAVNADAQSQKSKSAVNKNVKKTVPVKNSPHIQQEAINTKSVPSALEVEEPGLKFTFGIVGGIQNNYLLVHQKAEDVEATIPFMGLGYHFGGVVNAKFNDHFSIQPQIIAASKSTSFSSKNEFKLFTIDVPLNFLYHHQAFYIGGGPNFSYGVSAQHIDRINEVIKYDLYRNDESPSPILNKWNRLEIGAGIKMGYEFDMGISVNAVYNRGFSKMYNKPAVEDIPIDRVNTSTLSLALGYTFGK
jgi:hypothetical protein